MKKPEATTRRNGTVRCAIYTRKSTEEGLEQSFHTLQAQREAAEAYILSHREEGWRSVPAPYDDGGWSGANLERPGLARLLATTGTLQIKPRQLISFRHRRRSQAR